MRDGKVNGYAIVTTWVNGPRYDGDVVDNNGTGHDVATWPSDSRYEGGFVDGAANGAGVLVDSNGITYNGEWTKGCFRDGKKWAADEMKTTGPAAKLTLNADRNKITADGRDLSFITVTVADKSGLLVPRSNNHIKFSIAGPGEIVATDNGDATSFESFQSPERNAFNGLALVIVRAKAGQPGTIILKAESDGVKASTIQIKSN